ncbi:MAG: Mur ligase family protein [Candidatus Levyibacteriota bacterium]|nr:MAG: Mur ligase family protein [Candidatus Levybacteria bacterium]
MVKILISIGKIISQISRSLNLGNGSTWPGHIALKINKNFVRDALATSDQRLKTIIVAGTNGKTTTGKLIQAILEKSGNKVFQNEAGANLLNGIASSIMMHSKNGKITSDFAIFEVDENSLPLVLQQITPDYLVLLNLFRDQLDRYGEVNTIAVKWKKAIEQLNNQTILILNADDPQIAFLGKNNKNTKYFGLEDKSIAIKTPQYAADSTYCPNCHYKLTYKTIYFSHLGDWFCPNCSLARGPLAKISSYYPLSGVYNRYNTLAAVLVAKANNVNNETIQQSLKSFSPAFGRQEIIEINGKKVQIFLSKNPTSFNESLRTVKELNGKNLLLVLNDRIPDGRDVSWIWDVDFEEFIEKNINITVSGDRCYDIGLRIKYIEPLIHNTKYIIQENLGKAIKVALNKTPKNDVLYILPTYSAMLEVRKILTGRRIL